MSLPARYAWLDKETGPKLLLEALELYGVTETPGVRDNPTILSWAKELGLKDYVHDSIPWCGLFMAICAQRAGKPVPNKPLWAQNWLNFGHKPAAAGLGDVLVFVRPGGGHVGLYVGEDSSCYHVLGGNQDHDRVSISRVAKARCVGVRRPNWTTAQPANVRPIQLAATGAPSTNEA